MLEMLKMMETIIKRLERKKDAKEKKTRKKKDANIKRRIKAHPPQIKNQEARLNP